MNKTLAALLLALFAIGWSVAHAKNEIRDAIISGWLIRHFSDASSPVLMIGKDRKMIAAISDYPDSVEVRAFNGDSGEFLTFRDTNHDRVYEEVDGITDGMVLILGGQRYQVEQTNGKWSMAELP